MRVLKLGTLVLLVAVVAAAVSSVIYLIRRPATDSVARAVQGAGQPDGPANAAARAAASVVRIETGYPATPAPGEVARETPGGSGVVVDPRGFILTAQAVVAGAPRIAVTLPGGRVLDARVVTSDPQSGVSLLKVDAQGLKPINISAPAPLAAGAGVVVMSAPPAPVVNVGTVASVGVSLPVEDPGSPGGRSVMNDLMTLDLSARQGQVGAPLLDGSGRMLGMVVASGAKDGNVHAEDCPGGDSCPYLWAMDAVDLQPSIQQMVQDAHVIVPGLGFTYQQLSLSQAADRGVAAGLLVLAVTADSAAQRAGLVPGDVVLTADGTVLDPAHSLRRLLRELPQHQAVQLLLRGRDKPVSIEVTSVTP